MVVTAAAIWLTKESAGRLLDIGEQYLLNRMGLSGPQHNLPGIQSLLDEYLQRLTHKLDAERIAKLYGALSQLQDASRAASPGNLLTQALISFHEIVNYPDQEGATAGHSNAELCCLAYIGMSAAYIIMSERSELIAEKMIAAVYTDPKTARRWLGNKLVGEIIAHYPPKSLTQRTRIAQSQESNAIICPKCGYPNRVGAKYCIRDGVHLEQNAPGTVLFTYSGILQTANALVWSPDGKHIASGGEAIEIWNAATGKVILTYREHTGKQVKIHSLAWSPDGRYIASASNDKTVRVWEVISGKTFLSYYGHTTSVVAVAWSPDGKCIVSEGSDRVIHIWNTATSQTLLNHHRNTNWLSIGTQASNASLDWSPDGSSIVLAGFPIEIIDATSGSIILTYAKHPILFSALTVAWSPDGKHVASGGKDKTVHIWNAKTGHLFLTYRGHTGWVHTVAWSPDGKRLASASNDKSVHVWDATTGQRPLIYRHANSSHVITSVKWSPNGRHLALGGKEDHACNIVILQV